MKISIIDVSMCIYYSLLSGLFSVLLTSMCAYIYSGDATYWDISGFLIDYQLHHGECASCTDLDIILYLQHSKVKARICYVSA